MRMMTQIPLLFTRTLDSIVNDWGQVENGTTMDVDCRGSLQPMAIGEKSKVLPEGLWTTDVKVFYTQTELFPARNDNNNVSLAPDYTVINGKRYIVYDRGDWTTNVSALAHYKVVLVRKEGK